VEKRYYSDESLERVLLSLERRHGLSSADFYAKTVAGERIEGVSGFTRNVWTSMYREFCRLRGDDAFVVGVERALLT